MERSSTTGSLAARGLNLANPVLFLQRKVFVPVAHFQQQFLLYRISLCIHVLFELAHKLYGKGQGFVCFEGERPGDTRDSSYYGPGTKRKKTKKEE